MSDLLERQLTQLSAKLTAAVVGCSTQHLRDLVKKGEIKQTGRGKYDLFEIVKYFLDQPVDGLSKIQEANLDAVLQKARKDRLANDETERHLIPVADVQEFSHSYAGMFVQTFEAARKSVGALLDVKTRKKLDERFTTAREQLTTQLETFRSSCSRVDSSAPDSDT